MPSEMKNITEALLENSKSAIIGCLELHNKPIFSYRYEVCIILAINAWELLLKAYIAQNNPEVKLIKKDGHSKPFEECVSYVSSKLGKKFMPIEENLNRLYDFRCHIIHFYKENIDPILYALLHKNILYYNSFLKEEFNTDLSEQTHLILLPIGFKPFANPVDFLSKESEYSEASTPVKMFIKSILESTEKLNTQNIDDTILTGFNMSVINENRITNADIIAGITKDVNKAQLVVNNILGSVKITGDETAKKVQIDEESVFKTIYVLTYHDVINNCKKLYSDFKQNPNFNRIMKSIKGKAEYHKVRYLDINKKTGTGKDYYTQAIFEELNKNYTLKE
jgi:hypothetical protein